MDAANTHLSVKKPDTTDQSRVSKPSTRARLHNPAEQKKLLVAMLETGSIRKAVDSLGLNRSELYALTDSDVDFASFFSKARALLALRKVDECGDISDTPMEGVEYREQIDPKTGQIVELKRRADMLGHRKLMIDTRLAIAAKLLAGWSDRPRTQVNVGVGVAVDQQVSEERRKALIELREKIMLNKPKPVKSVEAERLDAMDVEPAQSPHPAFGGIPTLAANLQQTFHDNRQPSIPKRLPTNPAEPSAESNPAMEYGSDTWGLGHPDLP